MNKLCLPTLLSAVLILSCSSSERDIHPHISISRNQPSEAALQKASAESIVLQERIRSFHDAEHSYPTNFNELVLFCNHARQIFDPSKYRNVTFKPIDSGVEVTYDGLVGIHKLLFLTTGPSTTRFVIKPAQQNGSNLLPQVINIDLRLETNAPNPKP